MLRLALFNVAEAWIWAMLPLLLEDRRRCPTWLLVPVWFGALGLTNAFLAPYLAARELLALRSGEAGELEAEVDANSVVARGLGGSVFAGSFGLSAAAVAAYAALQVVTLSSDEWADFVRLCAADRTYGAFVVDLCLFSVFQAPRNHEHAPRMHALRCAAEYVKNGRSTHAFVTATRSYTSVLKPSDESQIVDSILSFSGCFSVV